MDQIAFFLAMIAGFLFGGIIVFLIQRNDVRQAYARARTEFNAEIAGLTERVKGREDQAAQLRGDLDERDRRMATVQEECASLRAAQNELQRRLETERPELPPVAETLASLQQSQENLAKRLHTLTVEAIRKSQDSILEVAKSKLESFRAPEQPAEAGTANWQEVLKPIEASIARLESRFQESGVVPVPVPAWDEVLKPIQDSIARVERCIQENGTAHTPAPLWNEALLPLQESLTRVEARVQENGVSRLSWPNWDDVLRPLLESVHKLESRIQEMEQSRVEGERKATRLREDLLAVRDLGDCVHQSLLTFGERFANLGRSLELSLESHNEAAVHLETRVLAAARRFRQVTAEPSGVAHAPAVSPRPDSSAELSRLAEAVAIEAATPAPAPEVVEVAVPAETAPQD